MEMETTELLDLSEDSATTSSTESFSEEFDTSLDVLKESDFDISSLSTETTELADVEINATNSVDLLILSVLVFAVVFYLIHNACQRMVTVR